MKDIIAKIDRQAVIADLSNARFVRKTNAGSNEIYIFTAHQAPVLMDEVGRLREETFRLAGGGTGKPADIDHYDTDEKPFHQLIVWNPEDQEIVGGYRFIHGKDIKIDDNGNAISATGRLFNFSQTFIDEFLPSTVELGRSFVQPLFQPSRDQRKGLFALDNLWDGLGSLHVDYSDTDYFFGKITMYPHFNVEARNIILRFMNIHFGDNEKLVRPFNPIIIDLESEYLKTLFSGESYEADYKILVREVRARGENIPPLVNAYMNLSPTMRVFGTAMNDAFGDVEETGILVRIKDITAAKYDRYVTSYINVKSKESDS